MLRALFLTYEQIVTQTLARKERPSRTNYLCFSTFHKKEKNEEFKRKEERKRDARRGSVLPSFLPRLRDRNASLSEGHTLRRIFMSITIASQACGNCVRSETVCRM